MSTAALKLVFIVLSWGLPHLASLPLHSSYLLLFDFLWLHTAVLLVTGTAFIPVQTKQVLSRIELHLCFVLCLFVRLDFAHWQKEIINSLWTKFFQFSLMDLISNMLLSGWACA